MRMRFKPFHIWMRRRVKTATWKLALWGSPRDQRALERLEWLFPRRLETYCELQGWGTDLPQQGPELRDQEGEGANRAVLSDRLASAKTLSMELYHKGTRYRFWMPNSLLIPNTKEYIRVRGGSTAIRLIEAPHILISKGWDLIIYSDVDFII